MPVLNKKSARRTQSVEQSVVAATVAPQVEERDASDFEFINIFDESRGKMHKRGGSTIKLDIMDTFDKAIIEQITDLTGVKRKKKLASFNANILVARYNAGTGNSADKRYFNVDIMGKTKDGKPKSIEVTYIPFFENNAADLAIIDELDAIMAEVGDGSEKALEAAQNAANARATEILHSFTLTMESAVAKEVVLPAF